MNRSRWARGKPRVRERWRFGNRDRRINRAVDDDQAVRERLGNWDDRKDEEEAEQSGFHRNNVGLLDKTHVPVSY